MRILLLVFALLVILASAAPSRKSCKNEYVGKVWSYCEKNKGNEDYADRPVWAHKIVTLCGEDLNYVTDVISINHVCPTGERMFRELNMEIFKERNSDSSKDS